jgi:uncharacterized protein (TIGR03435 family)
MEMIAKGQTMDALVQVPFFGLGSSPVVNKTGLTGRYDFTLDWTPEQPARLRRMILQHRLSLMHHLS